MFSTESCQNNCGFLHQSWAWRTGLWAHHLASLFKTLLWLVNTVQPGAQIASLNPYVYSQPVPFPPALGWSWFSLPILIFRVLSLFSLARGFLCFLTSMLSSHVCLPLLSCVMWCGTYPDTSVFSYLILFFLATFLSLSVHRELAWPGSAVHCMPLPPMPLVCILLWGTLLLRREFNICLDQNGQCSW